MPSAIHLGHTDICRDETVAARNPVNEAVVPQLPVDKNRTPQRVGMDTRDAATSLAVYAHCARHAPTDPVHWGAVRRARGGAHGAASDGMAHRIRFF